MFKETKELLLKGVAKAGRRAAVASDGWPSWLGVYQPEAPEALKKLKDQK